MSLSTPLEPITASDDAIRDAVAEAAVPPLVAALAHVTGDLTLLRDDLRVDPERVREPDLGFTAEQLAAARELAVEVLAGLRDGTIEPAPPPTDDALRTIMEFTVGERVSDDYVPLLQEELAVKGEDLRAPTWNRAEVAPDTPFRVVVIGAGMSGILAAHRLDQAGIDVVVIEKNDDVGGTWLENTYPGCRVDVANHVYSYSFAQRDDWPQHFSTQDVLLDYFRTCADELGVGDLIRFRTEVLSAAFDDDRRSWTVQVRTDDGAEETLHADAVVSAVGQLNRPRFPHIAGRDDFAGPSFHSAAWRHDLDLAGKRIAVIGTGASAAQFIPIVADQAAELLVFQRTPAWFIPTPDYHDPVGDGLNWVLRHVPFFSQWHRLFLFWISGDGALARVRVDPDWEPKDRSVSAANDEMRELLTLYLQVVFAEAPELLPAVVPDYPPGAKRVIRDNGIWPATLLRADVHLVTEAIERITPTGVRTCDGVEHEVDVVIYGTGFQASRFLTPMRVTGRGGADLHECWDGDARAYLGITVPRFPNLFLLYGPNTNIVVNGSIIFFSECEVHYLLECIRLLLERGGRALDVRPDVHDAYNARIDDGNRQMAWGVSTVNTWYRNELGRIAQNWPFTLLEYWQQTRRVDPSDYELL